MLDVLQSQIVGDIIICEDDDVAIEIRNGNSTLLSFTWCSVDNFEEGRDKSSSLSTILSHSSTQHPTPGLWAARLHPRRHSYMKQTILVLNLACWMEKVVYSDCYE